MNWMNWRAARESTGPRLRGGKARLKPWRTGASRFATRRTIAVWPIWSIKADDRRTLAARAEHLFGDERPGQQHARHRVRVRAGAHPRAAATEQNSGDAIEERYRGSDDYVARGGSGYEADPAMLDALGGSRACSAARGRSLGFCNTRPSVARDWAGAQPEPRPGHHATQMSFVEKIT